MTEWTRGTLGDLFIADNAKLGAHTTEPTVMSLSKYDGFIRAEDYFDKRIASTALDGYKVVEPGEWAFSTIHIDEGSIARNNTGERGVISPMYTTMRWQPSGNEPEFAELLVKAPHMIAEYRRRAQGSVNRRRSLPFRSFASIEVFLPPRAEQRRIVGLVSAIRAAVRALVVEADLLEAVAAAYAESAVEGWHHESLGVHLERIEGGRSPQARGESPSPDERGVLKVSAVTPFRFVPDESKALFNDTVMPESALVCDGDILITRANTPLRVGAVCRVPSGTRSGLYLCDKTLRLIPKPSLDPDYAVVALSLAVARQHLVGTATGTSASMFNISQQKIRETPVPMASPEKQAKVAEQVESLRATAEYQRSEASRLTAALDALLTSLLLHDLSVDEAADQFLPKNTVSDVEGAA